MIIREISRLRNDKALNSSISDISRDYYLLNTGIGAISVCHAKANKTVFNSNTPPVIIELFTRPDMPYPAGALANFIYKENSGVGYTITHSPGNECITINRGFAVPYGEWEQLCNLLQEIEGDSDETPPGCWYKQTDRSGMIPNYLLNGTPAHQYSPRSAISAESLAALVDRLHENIPAS